MSLELLQQAVRALETESGEMPPEAARWLRTGLRRYLDGDALENALHLTGTDLLRVRNRALKQAAMILDPDSELSAWDRAGRLARDLKRFEASTWPRVRHTDGTDLAPYRRALFDVLRSGAPPARSQRRIYDLATRGY
ncbi:hypothetical protein [Thioalkalivibrio sp. ALE12]|uniref:hypothetical protein n=1 Tax=Thioalkalivibrio sp. ALE12 TaxID=1158170 RepID=UPI001E302BC1|nr:hypothetical protein [Thioalkalivibrio sp. ALE12]